MLTIEFIPPKESEPCPCCGGKTTSLIRFVYKEGNDHAIYYALFTDNHPNHIVLASVSVGEWGEDASTDERVAFALKLQSTPKQYEVEVIDSIESPWRETKVIGRTLDRSEALKHPLIPEVFHITDHIFSEDKLIKAYLDGK